MVFLLLGRILLELLSVSPAALTADGGVIVLVIAMRKIFPTRDRTQREQVHEEPFVVPLAIPFTAGSFVLATELLLMRREPDHWFTWLTTLQRLMSMILVIVAMEMLMDGIAPYREQH